MEKDADPIGPYNDTCLNTLAKDTGIIIGEVIISPLIRWSNSLSHYTWIDRVKF